MLLMYSIIFTFILTLLLIFIWVINKVMLKMYRMKLSPYECGFDPNNSSRAPFSTRFFLLAVIFLVFDIEIVLLMMLPATMPSTNLMLFYFPVTLFLILLIMGTIYELNEGALNWTE